MTDSLVPDWIKQIKRQQDEQKAIAKQDAQQTALAAKTIQADGPAFWTQLLKELHITADSLPLIGVRATLTDLRGGELSHQFAVTRESSFPGHTYTNLFYVPGDYRIRCHPKDAPSFDLKFGLYGDTLSVSEDGGPMSPAEAAKYIAESALERLGKN